MLKLLPLLLAAALAACSGHETTPTAHEAGFEHTVEHSSALCRFDFAEDPHPTAKRLSVHQWAKDRYDNGLVIEWDIKSKKLRGLPVFRQALALVADTLYALVLPTYDLDTLHVRIELEDLSDGDFGYTVAQGGGVYWASGAKSGLPVRDKDRMFIKVDESGLEDDFDKPDYLSSLSHWYTVLLHESFHVLGFGTSPDWEASVCGMRSWRGHWSSLAYDGPGRALMFAYISSYQVLIAPETLCALEEVGWRVR